MSVLRWFARLPFTIYYVPLIFAGISLALLCAIPIMIRDRIKGSPLHTDGETKRW